MTTIAIDARTSHALAIQKLSTLAYSKGWRIIAPSENGPSYACLLLGRQVIPVHHIGAYEDNLASKLELLRRNILLNFVFEQYVVMDGFDTPARDAFQAKFYAVRGRSIIIGSLAEYQQWLTKRLGPLAHLGLESSVRQLMEDFLCLMPNLEPAEKAALTVQYKNSQIKPDFEYGQLGVQGSGTLFSHVKRQGAVMNLEGDLSSQKLGTDLSIASSFEGNKNILVEVKTERYVSGRISIELNSCYKAKPNTRYISPTLGWLYTSTADTLMSQIWPTGDVLIIDFAQLRQWVKDNPRKLKPQQGGLYSPQPYVSLVLLADMTSILEDIPGAVHINFKDWLPTLYPGEFQGRSLVSGSLNRTLMPNKLSYGAM